MMMGMGNDTITNATAGGSSWTITPYTGTVNLPGAVSYASPTPTPTPTGSGAPGAGTTISSTSLIPGIPDWVLMAAGGGLLVLMVAMKK